MKANRAHSHGCPVGWNQCLFSGENGALFALECPGWTAISIRYLREMYFLGLVEHSGPFWLEQGPIDGQIPNLPHAARLLTLIATDSCYQIKHVEGSEQGEPPNNRAKWSIVRFISCPFVTDLPLYWMLLEAHFLDNLCRVREKRIESKLRSGKGDV